MENQEDKIQITKEDQDIIDSFYKKAQDIKNLDQLNSFLRELTRKYFHDSVTMFHATTAAAIAAICFMNHSPQGDNVGNYDDAVMYEFVQRFGVIDGPITITKYEDMLYPQQEFNFKIITKDTWEWLKERAKYNLRTENPSHVSERVWNHWKSVASGNIPFGFSVYSEDSHELNEG